MAGPPRDPWHYLAERTAARIAIGRSGSSLPTREVLAFELAHAQARDAVYARFDRSTLAQQLGAMGVATVDVESEAQDRQTFLRRPDLGRRLTHASRARLLASAATCDIALMVGDGLSAAAASFYAATVIQALLPHLVSLNLTLGCVTLAEGARVALGDEVGEALGARMVAVLIGERPGLSAANSLSIYLTYAPKPGRTDAERNCISNIRAGGVDEARAAANLAWLIQAADAMGMTGVALKDLTPLAALPGQMPEARLP